MVDQLRPLPFAYRIPTSDGLSFMGHPFSSADLMAARAFAAQTPEGARVVKTLPPIGAEDAQQGLVASERALNAGVKTSRVLLTGESIEDVLTGGTHNATPSAKAISGLGALGGLVQTGSGVAQLARGELVEGVKNVGSGGLGTAAGVMELGAPATLAKKAVPLLAGASGVVEGVGDVVSAVKTDDVEKGVVGGVKAVGGAMLAASPFLGATGIGAPAAVVIGAAGGVLLAGAEIYDAFRHFTKKG